MHSFGIIFPSVAIVFAHVLPAGGACSIGPSGGPSSISKCLFMNKLARSSTLFSSSFIVFCTFCMFEPWGGPVTGNAELDVCGSLNLPETWVGLHWPMSGFDFISVALVIVADFEWGRLG